jgi:hypothetical protein
LCWSKNNGNKISSNPVAQAGISGVREIMPRLKTSKETEQVENNILGCAGSGAGTGAMIGGLIGMIGGPGGVACMRGWHFGWRSVSNSQHITIS